MSCLFRNQILNVIWDPNESEFALPQLRTIQIILSAALKLFFTAPKLIKI